jgi:hypothetical protein
MLKKLYLILIIGIYICIHAYFNAAVQKTGDDFYMDRIDKQKTTPKVYDVMHKVLPKNTGIHWLTNYMLVLSLLPLIFNFNSDLGYNFLGLLITVNIIRDISINLTILPKDIDCVPDKTIISHILGSCYDKIFSGHFSFVYILTLLYYSYGYFTSIPLLVSWNIINALIILVSRSHYTIDIVMAFFVCSFVFVQNYNFLNMFI